MEITLSWMGEEYDVTNFELTMNVGDTFKNLGAADLVMTLQADPVSGVFEKIYGFAVDQHSEAPKKGNGTLVIKPAAGKESIETIEISKGYFSDVHQSISAGDETLFLTAVLRASELTISSSAFVDEIQSRLMGE